MPEWMLKEFDALEYIGDFNEPIVEKNLIKSPNHKATRNTNLIPFYKESN